MPKERFYIWSMEGDGCALAWRLKAEGYEVVMRCEDRFMRQNLDGIVAKTTARPRVDDIIIFDGVGRGQVADELRSRGFLVVGAGELCDKLELDRQYAAAVWQQLDISTPRSENFTDIKSGIEFVSSYGGRWVFKPSGNLDCAFTYCARDEMDMVTMLLHFQSTLGERVEFTLQEFIEGVCISTEGWFDGEQWVSGAWNGTIEAKELCVGGCGPKTGCSWNVVWSYEQMPRVAEEVHSKLTAMLAEAAYVGPWDMNCIVNDKGEIFVLEATPRFGYDAIEAYAALLQQPLGEALASIAKQEADLWPVAEGEIAMAMRVAIAPYPFGSNEHPASGDIPIRYRHEDEGFLWLTGVKREKGKLLSAATDGMIGVITVVGSASDTYSISEALKQRARRLMIPDLIWRDDPGSGVMDQWMKLAFLGYDSPLQDLSSSPQVVTNPIG